MKLIATLVLSILVSPFSFAAEKAKSEGVVCQDCADNMAGKQATEGMKAMKHVINKTLDKQCEERMTMVYKVEYKDFFEKNNENFKSFVKKLDKIPAEKTRNFMDALKRRLYMEKNMNEDEMMLKSEAAMNEVCRFNWEEKMHYDEIFKAAGVDYFRYEYDYEVCDTQPSEGPGFQSLLKDLGFMTNGGFYLQRTKMIKNPVGKDPHNAMMVMTVGGEGEVKAESGFTGLVKKARNPRMKMSLYLPEVTKTGDTVVVNIEGSNLEEFSTNLAKKSCAVRNEVKK